VTELQLWTNVYDNHYMQGIQKDNDRRLQQQINYNSYISNNKILSQVLVNCGVAAGLLRSLPPEKRFMITGAELVARAKT